MCGAAAFGLVGANDPVVFCEAQQRCARRFTADACHECQASGIGLQIGAEGLQGKDAQRIEHATVSGAASAVPSAGGGVCAALYGEYMRGDSVGAGVERLIAADAAAAAGDVGNGAIPLAAISFLLGALVSRFGWLAVGKISGRDPEAVFASQKGR